MESGSQLYSQGKQMLGMLPGQYRSGGTGTAIRFAMAECSLGSLLVAETSQGLCAISLGDAPEPLLEEFQARFAGAELLPPDPAFDSKVARVISLVEDPKQSRTYRCHWIYAAPLSSNGSGRRCSRYHRAPPCPIRLWPKHLANREPPGQWLRPAPPTH